MTNMRGYTLLEMLVVIGLFALATSLVAPMSYRMAESWRESTRVDAVLQQLAALPLRARDTGRQLELTGADATAAADIELPEGWQLVFAQPLMVRANGACSHAEGHLQTSRQTIAFVVQPPFCRVQRLAAEVR